MPFKKTLLCMAACLFTLFSEVAAASKAGSVDADDYEATLERVKQVCKPLKVPLPTTEDLQKIEEEIGPIPSQLRKYMEECGNLGSKGYDIACAHRPDEDPDSEYIDLNREFREHAQDYQNFHAFCDNNSDFFCIDPKTGVVRYWRHYDRVLSIRDCDCWPTFNNWLKNVLLPRQKGS